MLISMPKRRKRLTGPLVADFGLAQIKPFTALDSFDVGAPSITSLSSIASASALLGVTGQVRPAVEVNSFDLVGQLSEMVNFSGHLSAIVSHNLSAGTQLTESSSGYSFDAGEQIREIMQRGTLNLGSLPRTALESVGSSPIHLGVAGEVQRATNGPIAAALSIFSEFSVNVSAPLTSQTFVETISKLQMGPGLHDLMAQVDVSRVLGKMTSAIHDATPDFASVMRGVGAGAVLSDLLRDTTLGGAVAPNALAAATAMLQRVTAIDLSITQSVTADAIAHDVLSLTGAEELSAVERASLAVYAGLLALCLLTWFYIEHPQLAAAGLATVTATSWCAALTRFIYSELDRQSGDFVDATPD